eukprot:2529809-Amphidinium_carterae.1
MVSPVAQGLVDHLTWWKNPGIVYRLKVVADMSSPNSDDRVGPSSSGPWNGVGSNLATAEVLSLQSDKPNSNNIMDEAHSQ